MGAELGVRLTADVDSYVATVGRILVSDKTFILKMSDLSISLPLPLCHQSVEQLQKNLP